ncbi:MAG: cytochrome b/b6 domain-containing protein [Bacteroidia bacterium]|jgi:thiosulfate reductase cytochrome b subunit|nr:cytochrome b/b6 domain-containing protein [Bacteroidia bacterium]
MEYKKQYLYLKFERFWHWAQMLLVLLLALTGFEIHGNLTLIGFENAVRIHNAAAWTFMGLAVVSIFWMIVSGQYINFIPTTKKLKEQVRYYTSGIFKGMPHPTHKELYNKLNPLQRLTYAGLLFLIFPVQIITGLAYMYFRYPQNPVDADGLMVAVLLHTLGSFLVVAFVIVHVYMTTTGNTITSNLKAMISGYEREAAGKKDDADHPKEEVNDQTK